MALQCQVSLNVSACTAGQSQSPMATVQVYNPNASAVVVTAIDINFWSPEGVRLNPCANQSSPPIGYGQTVSVPTLSSLYFGPFPLAFGSAASANAFQMVPPSSQPSNPQGAHKPQQQIFVGATVLGSDGSVNEAGRDGVLVSFAIAPPLGFQGGFTQFAGVNNAVLLAAVF